MTAVKNDPVPNDKGKRELSVSYFAVYIIFVFEFYQHQFIYVAIAGTLFEIVVADSTVKNGLNS